ncbi:MAG TPA: HAMP domain-containing sensor histidine kinase [Flavobacterium sp.]|nr:HAMP domain-containing sensor histidine kinase [Flavobacterium sp.]
MLQNHKLHNQLFYRLLVLLAALVLAAFFFYKDLIYSSFFVAFLILMLAAELSHFIKNAFQFYDKMIKAMLQNDFSADFSNNAVHKNYSVLLRLYQKLKDKQHDHLSKDIIYSTILNSIESSIIILEKEKEEWNIFLMNDHFSNYFEVPKVSRWRYLKNKLPALCEIIELQQFGEIKTSLNIRVDGRDAQTFVIQGSATKTFNKEYYIILLDSIQKVVEKKEKEAWISLMKVISHELLNSLTPIRSLSQNLNELVQQETLSPEDLDDIKQSVATMLNRSNHLQEFVEGYRKLAMLPSPQKERTELSAFIEGVLQVMAPLLKNEGIEVINTAALQRWLVIDRQQIEQVMINLLTNSLHALAGQTEKRIIIAAEAKEKRVFITITDTGKGIEKQIEDKIFLPFFTTRKHGSGIGLTLSRSIIESHGGYLAYQNNGGNTCFTVCLFESEK